MKIENESRSHKKRKEKEERRERRKGSEEVNHRNLEIRGCLEGTRLSNFQEGVHINHSNERRGSPCFLRFLEELHCSLVQISRCLFIHPVPLVLVSVGMDSNWSCPTVHRCRWTLLKTDLMVS